MTKGIREAAVAKFAEYLPKRAEIGNTAFRKSVMSDLMSMFDISLASAATHYNHALKDARTRMPEQVKDLGRAEDKKGGRKPIHTVDVVKCKTGEVVASGLSRAAAQALVDAAAAKKKAKLEIRAAVTETAETAEAGTAAEAAVEAVAETAEAA